MATPEMRASDGDRDRVAEALREHMAQGRLTVDEFNERLELLYTSKTYGELAKLTSDLPETDLHNLPARRPEEQRKPSGKQRNALRAAWAAWATVSAINWTIWLIVSLTTFDLIYPWPIWVMGPWGVVLLVSTLFAEGGRKR